MALHGTYVPSKAAWVREQVAAFEASDGAEANTLRGGSDPIVVITSVGAKSGNLRKNPVMRVERDGEYVAIASKGGAPDQPEWYYNFLAHPICGGPESSQGRGGRLPILACHRSPFGRPGFRSDGAHDGCPRPGGGPVGKER